MAMPDRSTPAAAGLRIAVLEPVPRSGGGSEAMSLAIARLLADAGAHLHLLHQEPGDLVERYAGIGAHSMQLTLPLFTRRAPVSLAKGVIGLARVLRASGIDLVVTSHLGYVRQLAAIRAFAGVPTLYHLGLPSIGSDAGLRWSYQRMAMGVGPSEALADGWMRDGWPRDRMAVVPNWVDTQRFGPVERVATRARLGMRQDATYIASVGRMSRDKGTPDLIAAFARIAVARPALRLLLVGPTGDGFAMERDEAIAALPADVRERVDVRGATSEPEAWYGSANIACSASRAEAYGLAVAEAMACGVPVVATAVGSAPALLGESGRCIQPGDVDALADVLAHWADAGDAVRASQGAAMRLRMLGDRSAAEAADAYVRLALQAAGRR